ncbi:MAG TPA: tetratricopeptide repeat protein, partial [Mucilaginibacter sp.]
MRKVIFLFSLFSGLWTYAQTRQIDSLKLKIKKTTREDTLRVIDLNELGWQYLDYSVDSSGKYVRAALQLSEKLGYLNGIVEAKSSQGILYRYANEPQKAIKLYAEVIELRTKQGRLDRLTGAYANLGSVYYQENDYAEGLRYYLKAFQNASTFKQSDNQIALLNNIGAIYKSSGLTDLAIEAFKKGLEINKNRKDEFQEGLLYLNLGTIYDQQGLFNESVKYDKYAYDIFKKTGNTRQLSVTLNNLSLSLRHAKDLKGTETVLKEMQEVADYLKEDEYYGSFYQSKANYLQELHKYAEALKNIDKAIRFTDTINDRLTYAGRLLSKSDIHQKLGEYSKAIDYCDKGLMIAKEMEDKYKLSSGYISKSEIYQATGDFKNSLQYYQLAVKLNDSLTTDALNTKLATLNSLAELDKKENELALSIKEKENVEVKNKQQFVLLVGTFVIGILVIVLLIFSFRAYRVKKKDNELLNHQKDEIENQKSLIEEKQKEILDSIHYAQRIQQTLL